MLWTIFVVLLVLWALGMVTAYTMGGFIHILLLLAIVSVLIRLLGAGESYEYKLENEGVRNHAALSVDQLNNVGSCGTVYSN